jgi:molybdate transport system ATP-binding protein
MINSQHWNFLLSNQVDKKKFITSIFSENAPAELSFLHGLKGVLFSDLAIHDFIQKEYKYDAMETELNSERKLTTFSSGEQKKRYLKYCLTQKVNYIVFDNPLDHLDHDSRLSFQAELEKLATSIIIIHIVNRKNDLLPFIENNKQVSATTFSLHPITVDSLAEPLSKTEIPTSIAYEHYDGPILIEMNHVSVSYMEHKIITAIDWVVKKGEFWQLIGPNGSGKSTILSLITGENSKGYGQELYLFGRKKGSGESVWDIKKQIGYFSNAAAIAYQGSHTLEEMILSGFFDSVGLYVQPTVQQIKIAQQWLNVAKIEHLKNEKYKQLTVGQQRLALIIRALVKQPPLLILDEPLEGLDDQNANRVIQLINILIKETSMAIIYVSHRIETNLNPTAILELIPSENGSIGKQH